MMQHKPELCPRLEYPSKQASRQNGRSLLFVLHQRENRQTTNRGLLWVRSTNSRLPFTICTVTRSTHNEIVFYQFSTCIHAIDQKG